VPTRSIIDELKRKAEALDYDLDAYRWLLYFAVFLVFFAIMMAWNIADLRDGIIASAEGQRRIYKEMSVLQQEITALQRDLARARFDGRMKGGAPEQTLQGDPNNPAAPVTLMDQARPGRADQSRQKTRP
jgi:hypothetical protein